MECKHEVHNWSWNLLRTANSKRSAANKIAKQTILLYLLYLELAFANSWNCEISLPTFDFVPPSDFSNEDCCSWPNSGILIDNHLHRSVWWCSVPGGRINTECREDEHQILSTFMMEFVNSRSESCTKLETKPPIQTNDSQFCSRCFQCSHRFI